MRKKGEFFVFICIIFILVFGSVLLIESSLHAGSAMELCWIYGVDYEQTGEICWMDYESNCAIGLPCDP